MGPKGAARGTQGANCNGGGAAAGEKDAAAVSGWRPDGCRKGRKALAPWRFGFKGRPWTSQGNGSRGTYRSSRQYALPAAAPKQKSHVRVVSAAATSKNRSTLMKVQIGPAAAASVVRKKKGMKKAVVALHQEIPRNRVATVSRETAMAALHEFRILRERFSVERQHDDRRYVGSVPGVEVGDVFASAAELRFVGLHRSRGSSIDYIISKKGGSTCLAVSVVSEYVQHAHKDNHPELLLHIAHNMGGTEEQLALKQSMDSRTPVRVIYWVVVADHEAAGNSQSDELPCYVYAGLYTVERKDHGAGTYQLTRILGQPQINIQELAEKRLSKPSNRTFVSDISWGLEKIPVSLINSIENEYPAAFVYILERQHHPKYQLNPPSGCDCVGGCSDSQECACAVKNGGEIPFSDDGRILRDKPLVYECGPSCKCPPTCHNKVSQHRIKFRLQVFKTASMGWGVRCLDYIPAGSFVCEYVGELLDDEEAEEKENDVYLFNTGGNYFDVPRWEGLLKTIPSLRNGPGEDEVEVFVVDALKRGNVARFVNHSCTPNLFTQNVLYDHEDIRMPHIMLFAFDDIPPLQPLSLDYNYTLDGVHDSQGKIKKKPCFCGSSKCRGRLY